MFIESHRPCQGLVPTPESVTLARECCILSGQARFIRPFSKLVGEITSFYYFLFFYCCSVTVIPDFSPVALPCPATHPTLSVTPCPVVHYHGPLYMFLDQTSSFPLFPFFLSPPSPLITVSLFLISMSLFLFCLFVLLIMFHLQVRSYGICLSSPGLFHLA